MTNESNQLNKNGKADDKQGNNNKTPHRWKHGESGNPNGRPKKNISITSIQTDAPASC